jgi:26S proteasome regulatory subunit T2
VPLLAQVEKAPLESYADVGGLEQQVTEIKEAVELPLTHPELYEDIGIKPPKVCLVMVGLHPELMVGLHPELMVGLHPEPLARLHNPSMEQRHQPTIGTRHMYSWFSNTNIFVQMQGVILYGEPGTGKTLLAKAVANSTSATFLRVVGSELIQKYLGDGPKLVRELFRVAEDLAPTIVFIGTVDEMT